VLTVQAAFLPQCGQTDDTERQTDSQTKSQTPLNGTAIGMDNKAIYTSVSELNADRRRNRMDKSLNMRAWLKVNHDSLVNMGM